MDPTTAELDLFQPSTLYWKSVPVFLKRSDKDERFQDLTIRIIAGLQRGNHSQRVLRIYVSSDADLFFLYVLEVNEDDFAALKLDQGILVDFANFPGKIIGLLEKCITCKGEELPRFQAVLQTFGGQGSFKLVETNDFKQLPHITLLFRPGNDAAVKQFLAFRLTELSSDCQQLSSELSKAQGERNILQSSLTETKRLLANTKDQHDKHVMEFEADIKAKEVMLAEAKTKELSELRDEHLRERSGAESKFKEQISAAQQRIDELDTDNRALRQQKYELDTKVSELSHKLGATEGSNRSLNDEVDRLRTQVQQLSRDKAERDVEIGEALTKVHALEDKVDTQKEVIAEQADRIRGTEAALRQVETRAEELKAASHGHEERAKEATAEILKANEIIEKLSNDLRTMKEKMRRKTAIISRQEEEVQQRDQALEESRQQTRSLQRELDRATSDADSHKREVEELKHKLEDSKKQLQGNEQMIRWLNNQITESQLHYSGASGGLVSSRYTFRPSAPATSTLSGAGGPTGSTASTGAAPSLSRGIGAYKPPAVPTSSGGSGLPQGVTSQAMSAGTTPTSVASVSGFSGGGTAASIPGSGRSGYSSLYTGASALSGYTRQSGASGGSVPAARALNLHGSNNSAAESGSAMMAGHAQGAQLTSRSSPNLRPNAGQAAPAMTANVQ